MSAHPLTALLMGAAPDRQYGEPQAIDDPAVLAALDEMTRVVERMRAVEKLFKLACSAMDAQRDAVLDAIHAWRPELERRDFKFSLVNRSICVALEEDEPSPPQEAWVKALMASPEFNEMSPDLPERNEGSKIHGS